MGHFTIVTFHFSPLFYKTVVGLRPTMTSGNFSEALYYGGLLFKRFCFTLFISPSFNNSLKEIVNTCFCLLTVEVEFWISSQFCPPSKGLRVECTVPLQVESRVFLQTRDIQLFILGVIEIISPLPCL